MSDEIIVMVGEMRRWGTGRGPFRDKASCHLTVNGSTPEHLAALHAMACTIGLRFSWFQAPPKASTPHYDLVESKRTAAIEAGAVFVPARTQGIQRNAARRAT